MVRYRRGQTTSSAKQRKKKTTYKKYSSVLRATALLQKAREDTQHSVELRRKQPQDLSAADVSEPIRGRHLMSNYAFKPSDPTHRDDKASRLPTPLTNIRDDSKPVMMPRMPAQIISVRDEKSLNLTRIPQTLMSTPDIVKASTMQNVANLSKAVPTKPLIQVPQAVTHTLHLQGVPKVVGTKTMNPVTHLQTQVSAMPTQVVATPLQTLQKSQIKPKQKGILSIQETHTHHPGLTQSSTMPSHTLSAAAASVPHTTAQHPQPLVSTHIPTCLHQTHSLASQLHQPHVAHHAGMIPSIITAPQKVAMPQRVAAPPQSHLTGHHFSHVPRGAAAAASALTAPKGSLATAVRPVTTPTGDPHRTIVSSHPTTSTPSVQITIQQTPRTMDIQHRPVLSQYTGSHVALSTSKTVHLPQPLPQTIQQQKLIISTASIAAVSHPNITTVSIPKTMACLSTTTAGTVITTTTATVAAGVPLPMAKVHPHALRPPLPGGQITVDTSRTETTTAPTTTQGLFLAQAPRPATTTIATVASATTQSEPARPALPQVLQPYHTIPFSNLEYMNYHGMQPSLMQYSHIAANAASQPPYVASTGSNTRPGMVAPSQTPNLAATLQAHNIAVTSATTMKMTPVMVSMEPKPARQLSIRSPQYTAVTEVSQVAAGDASLISQSQGQLLGLAAQQATTLLPSTSQSNNNNTATNASPRPSILRKRPNEGPIVVKKALNMSDSATSSPKADSAPMSATSSPKPLIDACSRENSQSSTDTASSAENSNQSPPIAMQTTEVKVKQEPMETSENGPVLSSGALTPAISQSNSIEASPRKKPRKQLLNANEELKDEPVSESSADNILDDLDTSFENDKESYIDDEGTRWVNMRRRNQVALLNFYSCTWKAKNNHFYRQSDVKIKDERRPTVNELSNQKGIMQKASGWKLYHLAAQLEDMNDCEEDVKTKMAAVQKSLIPKGKHFPLVDDDMSRVHDLTQGNIQRSQLIIDQLEEAKSSMIKILDHKQRIMEIVNKHHSKRPVKKKERS